MIQPGFVLEYLEELAAAQKGDRVRHQPCASMRDQIVKAGVNLRYGAFGRPDDLEMEARNDRKQSAGKSVTIGPETREVLVGLLVRRGRA